MRIYQKERDKYCRKSGLKLSGYNSPTRLIFDLLKIEAFGSCIDYYIYDKQWWNKKRHQKQKASVRDEFGNTNYFYQCEMLKMLISEMYNGAPDAQEQYANLRNRQAKVAYYKRSNENGKNEERRIKNKIRRHNDPEYRQHLRERAKAIEKRDPERIRSYKRKYALANRDKQNEKYWNNTYGELASVAKEVWSLEQEIRKTKKGRGDENPQDN